MKTLTPIQKEIVTALEQMKEKALITEANLVKKVRENAKISGKNKTGICLKDRNRQSKPKFTQRKSIQSLKCTPIIGHFNQADFKVVYAEIRGNQRKFSLIFLKSLKINVILNL